MQVGQQDKSPECFLLPSTDGIKHVRKHQEVNFLLEISCKIMCIIFSPYQTTDGGLMM